MKKRLSSLLLIIMLLVNCLPFQGVAAIGTPQYILEDKTVQVGDTFTMDVAIADNPGIISLRFEVAYDTDVLELLSVTNSEVFNGFTTPAPTITSPYTLRWADSLASTNNTANGQFVKLTFKIKEGTKHGKYNISVSHIEARNVDGAKVVFSNASVNVIVNETSFIIGDVNDDGIIDSVDYLLLKRYCFSTYTFSNEQFQKGDIDKNGEIDSLDYLLLKRICFGTYKVV